MKIGFTGRVTRASAVRPWPTIVARAVGLVVAVAAAGSLGDALVQDDKAPIPTESSTADTIAREARERRSTRSHPKASCVAN